LGEIGSNPVGVQAAQSRGTSVEQMPSNSQTELEAHMVQHRDAFEQSNIRQTHVLGRIAEQISGDEFKTMFDNQCLKGRCFKLNYFPILKLAVY
jgi:hypothetical protein